MYQTALQTWIVFASITMWSHVTCYQQSSAPTTVSFTEGQASHMQLIQGDIMIYDTHITNINSKFDEFTGKFVCTTPGLYIFNFHSLTYKTFTLWFELYHNGDYVVSLYGYTTSDYADAGNSVILSLQAGDTVYVKAHDLYNNVLFGNPDEIYSTFTGVLLKPFTYGVEIVNFDDTTVFSAGLNYHATFYDHNVMYNHIFFANVSNTNVGYNPHTGEYMVPQTGIYLFHYHGISLQGKYVHAIVQSQWEPTEEYQLKVNIPVLVQITIHKANEKVANEVKHVNFYQRSETGCSGWILWLDLYQGNQYINSIYGHTASDNADAGNTAILNLNKGEKIYVKSRNGQKVDLYGTPEEIYNTFSGALLSPSISRRRDNHEEVAFSVGLSSNFSQSVGQRVKFDRIFINFGNAFDITSGTFTAKDGGVYVFHFHAVSHPGKPVWIDLYHNYKYIDSLYGHVPNGRAAAGNSASLELSAGDRVFLDIGGHDSWLYGQRDEVFCTFSGYLLSLTSDYHPTIVG